MNPDPDFTAPDSIRLGIWGWAALMGWADMIWNEGKIRLDMVQKRGFFGHKNSI